MIRLLREILDVLPSWTARSAMLAYMHHAQFHLRSALSLQCPFSSEKHQLEKYVPFQLMFQFHLQLLYIHPIRQDAHDQGQDEPDSMFYRVSFF